MDAGHSPAFFEMVYRFRIPYWYKLTTLSIYSASGYVIFGDFFLYLPLWLATTVILFFSTIGIWIIILWKKEVVYDSSNGTLKVGNVLITSGDVERVIGGVLKVDFVMKNGDVVSFRYPLEDVQTLVDVLRGVKS